MHGIRSVYIWVSSVLYVHLRLSTQQPADDFTSSVLRCLLCSLSTPLNSKLSFVFQGSTHPLVIASLKLHVKRRSLSRSVWRYNQILNHQKTTARKRDSFWTFNVSHLFCKSILSTSFQTFQRPQPLSLLHIESPSASSTNTPQAAISLLLLAVWMDQLTEPERTSRDGEECPMAMGRQGLRSAV